MDDYGSDIAGVDDIDAELSFVSGLRCYAEDLVRRLGCMPGSMEDDPTYGYDLTMSIGDTVDTAEVERKVVEQMLFDERTASATASVALIAGTLLVTIQVVAKTGVTFTLVVEASKLNVQLLDLKEAA